MGTSSLTAPAVPPGTRCCSWRWAWAQQLLRAAGKSPLYPRLRRDAVILYGLDRGQPLLTVQENLSKYGLTELGGVGNGND